MKSFRTAQHPYPVVSIPPACLGDAAFDYAHTPDITNKDACFSSKPFPANAGSVP